MSRDGAAFRCGLQEGDVIFGVNGVDYSADAAAAWADADVSTGGTAAEEDEDEDEEETGEDAALSSSLESLLDGPGILEGFDLDA